MSKYALCIGINYPDTTAALSGCVNDANDWAALLASRGFDVKVLTDGQATGQRIRAGITGVLQSADRGDSVVITYSGHGTRVPDTSGDEPDGWDEAICPADLWSNGVIVDDELHELFAERHPGTRAVMISDSCHSGTVSRFAAPFADHAGVTPRPRFLPPSEFLKGAALEQAQSRAGAGRLLGFGKPRYPHLLIAGCADVEYSYDASFHGRPNGAFTRAALDAFAEQDTPVGYRTWFAATRRRLPSADFPDQTPQLYGTNTQKVWHALA